MNYNEIFGLNDEYEIMQYYNPRYFDMMPRELPIQNALNEGLYKNSKTYFIGYTNVSELESLTECLSETPNVVVVDMRDWDLTNVITMKECFSNCKAKIIIFGEHPECDNLTSMYRCFYNTTCRKLDIRGIDTSKIDDFRYFLYLNTNLTELYGLNFSSVTSSEFLGSFFYNSNLVHTDGFKNLKCSWNNNDGLARCAYLSKQSCLNIIDGLYDFTTHGETPTSSQGILKVHPNFISNLTEEELQVAVAKGWSIIS